MEEDVEEEQEEVVGETTRNCKLRLVTVYSRNNIFPHSERANEYAYY